MQNRINWQKVDNLLPVIVQNVNTCEVLMLGYMNKEALAKTIIENKVTFFLALNRDYGQKVKLQVILCGLSI